MRPKNTRALTQVGLTPKNGADVLIHPNIHLGFAADTPKGLLVPVVRNANADNPMALSASITTQMDKARDGSASPASDLTGGTITVTNVGVFGVDGGTPIITPWSGRRSRYGSDHSQTVGSRRLHCDPADHATDFFISTTE